MREDDILERCRSYFQTLINEENEHELEQTICLRAPLKEFKTRGEQSIKWDEKWKSLAL